VSPSPVRLVSDCLFCKIAGGGVASAPLYRDARVLAIEDIDPQAPTHILVLPVEHYATLSDLIEGRESDVLGALFAVATRLGRERGGSGGFRIVVNTGPVGGQTVGHVHVHVLTGRQMTWPPG
jgi:histidine triad (HIT) family protein